MAAQVQWPLKVAAQVLPSRHRECLTSTPRRSARPPLHRSRPGQGSLTAHRSASPCRQQEHLGCAAQLLQAAHCHPKPTPAKLGAGRRRKVHLGLSLGMGDAAATRSAPVPQTPVLQKAATCDPHQPGLPAVPGLPALPAGPAKLVGHNVQHGAAIPCPLQARNPIQRRVLPQGAAPKVFHKPC